MQTQISRSIIISLLIAAMVILTAPNTGALNLGDIFKVGGIAVVVETFGNQINAFVNKLTFNYNNGMQEATKVVPILSLGSGGYLGAAQVIGAKENVDKTKAVVQVEANALFGRSMRVKALVPVGSKTTSNIKRIYGVGVSAIIDVKI